MVIMWKDKSGELYAANILKSEIRLIRIRDDAGYIVLWIDFEARTPGSANRCIVGAFSTVEAAENALKQIAMCAAESGDNVFVELGEDGVKLVQHKQPVNGAGWQYCSYTEGGESI